MNATNNYHRTIRLNVARYRRELHLTQAQLAEKLGMSVSYIGHIEAENSRSFPTLDTLISISEALDIPLYLLFVREEDCI